MGAYSKGGLYEGGLIKFLKTSCIAIISFKVSHKDNREEAMQYESNAIAVFKSVCHEESEQLIGHIPIEISQLINYFLEAATTNTMTAVVTGKRKREIGLVVPAKYVAYTENQKHAQILIKKLLEKQHLLELLFHRELFKMSRIFHF